MANITVLDQSTINQIAAGEVIERPASVVKELLENAIDARATAVTVEIRDGGTTFIRVTDNGCGIPKEEVAVAFLRHSTSKIKSVEDLFTVSSLGFRGEALASIAAVAQVELITKTSDSFTGTRYQINGGVEHSTEEIGAPDGTTFLVRNLFYNTPARKKFLKTPMTEGAHIGDLVEKIALSHPEVSVRFISNNQTKLHTSGNHSLKDIIYTIYGRETAANLLEVGESGKEASVRGFVGKPVVSRGNRSFENYFINGRYIRSNIVSKAIEEAFKPYMMQHRYPFTMLHFTIDSKLLDVNVHPTKMELRFRDGEMVYQLVYRAVSQALACKELIPQVQPGKDEKKEFLPKENDPVLKPFEVRRQQAAIQDQREKEERGQEGLEGKTAAQSFSAPKFAFSQTLKENKNPKTEPISLKNSFLAEQNQLEQQWVKESQALQESQQMTLFQEKLLEPKSRARHKLIGQVFDTYWLVEFNDQLYIIDQHAAHEKVLYEKTMASLKNREYTSQMVDPPIILTLNMNQELLLTQHMKYFADMGFEIEHFGGREYAVRGIPDNLFSIAKRDLLIEMIDGLSDDTGIARPDLIRERVASMSCKAAVKGGHQLSFAEANELIDQLLLLENPYACPHGRPTIIAMSKNELEKKFKRIV